MLIEQHQNISLYIYITVFFEEEEKKPRNKKNPINHKINEVYEFDDKIRFSFHLRIYSLLLILQKESASHRA